MKVKFVAFDQSRQYICILSKRNNLECFKTINKNCISFCKKNLLIKKKIFHIEFRSFFFHSFKKFYDKQFVSFRIFLFSVNNVYILNTDKKYWINIQMKKFFKSFNASSYEVYIVSGNTLFIFDTDTGEILKKISIKYFIKIFNCYLNIKISKNDQYLFFQTESLVSISLNFGCILQYLQNNLNKQCTISFLNPRFLILLFEKNLVKIWNFKEKKIKKVNFFFNFQKIKIKSLKKIFIQKKLFLALFSEKILFLCSLTKLDDLSNVKIKVSFLIKFYQKILSIWMSSKDYLSLIILFNKKKIIPIKLNLNSSKSSRDVDTCLPKVKNHYTTDTYHTSLLVNNFKNFFKTNLYLVSKNVSKKNGIQFVNVKFKAEKKYFIKVKKVDSKQLSNMFSLLTATKETINLKQFLKVNKTYNSKLVTTFDKFYILPLVILSIQEILHIDQKKRHYFTHVNHVIFHYFSCLSKENFLKHFLTKIESFKKKFIAKEILHGLLLKINILRNQNEKHISLVS
nr:hypothetical protein CparaKRNrm3_p084 [Cryptomonas paramecium]